MDIDEDKSEILEFEIEIPKDLEENEYAIFIKVIDDENYCNDEYTKINIERKKNDVVIEDFKIEPEDALCGDYVSVQTKLKNFGTKDEMVYIVIENEKMDIYEKTEEFEIEKFDDRDEVSQNIEIKIPEDASGNYEIKASVFFDKGNEESFVYRNLNIKCEELNIETKTSVQEIVHGGTVEKAVSRYSSNAVIALMIIVAVLIFILIILWFFY